MKQEGFTITPEFAAELQEIVHDLQQGGVKVAGPRMEELLGKVEMPAAIAKGQDCAGCIACGACPVTHIKAGYLLAAFAVG